MTFNSDFDRDHLKNDPDEVLKLLVNIRKEIQEIKGENIELKSRILTLENELA